MAKRNDSSRIGKSDFNSRFVNISLSKQHEQHLKELVASGKLGVELAFDLVSEGYKFSVNYDSNNHSYVASFTSYPAEDRRSCVILTGRGSNPLNAIFSLLYKHLVISEGLWAVGDDSSGAVGDFG